MQLIPIHPRRGSDLVYGSKLDQLISLNSIEREKNYYSLTDNSGQYTDSPRPESWKYHIRPMSLEGTVSLLQFQSPLDARTGNDGKGEDQND